MGERKEERDEEVTTMMARGGYQLVALSCCLVALAGVVRAEVKRPWTVNEADFHAWLESNGGNAIRAKDSPMERWVKVLDSAQHWAEGELAASGVDPKQFASLPEHNDEEPPYWNFFPVEMGAVIPDQDRDSIIIGDCYTYTGVATTQEDGSTLLSLDAALNDGKEEGCSEYLVLGAMTALGHEAVTEEGTIEYVWTLPEDATEGEEWDLEHKGIRLFRWRFSPAKIMEHLLRTVLLFAPEKTQEVADIWASMNADFMNTYTDFVYDKRDPSSNVVLTPDDIQSGDAFGLIRLDGLSPTIAWATGSTCGHVTVALELGGEMYVTESTVASEYWPVDGIQKTPFNEWVSRVQASDYLVVHIPLTDEARANYNLTAAQEFFLENEGYEYGFFNFLFGWLDVPDGTETGANMPYLPPEFNTNHLPWSYWTVLMGAMDRAFPYAADVLWIQALNLRLGTTGLRTADAFYQAYQRGMAVDAFINMPELDSYEYQTTRYGEPAVGRSMVCCVYGCSSLKAAGVFGDLADSINCAEMTDFDIFQSDIFQKNTAQISGDYTLTINEIGSKTPYAGVAESCPTIQPDYAGREYC